MSAVGGYGREQLRRSYVEAWRKHREGAPLSPLEAMLVAVLEAHPEYQGLMEDAPRAMAYEPSAADGANPFLHLGLHIAVREQIAVDRPPGVAALHRALLAAQWAPLEAEHVLMDALAETLWEAQRAGRAPDEQAYLARARRRLAPTQR